MQITVSLTALTGSFSTDIDRAAKQAEKSFKRLQAESGRAFASIQRNLVTAAAAFISFGAIKGAFNGFIESASHLKNFSEQVGISISTLVQLEKQAEKAGIAQDSFEKSLINLSQAQAKAVDGSKDAIAAFEAIGISQKELASLKTEDLLFRIADRLKLYEDGGRKAAAVSQLFGEKNVKLINFLNKGSAAIQEQGKRFKELGDQYQNNADKADDFDGKLKSLAADGELLRNSFALGLIKSLETSLAKFDAGEAKVKDFSGALEDMGRIVGGIAKAFLIAGIAATEGLSVVGKAIGARLAELFNPELAEKIRTEYYADLEEANKRIKSSFDILYGEDIPKAVDTGLGKAAETGSKHIGKLGADVKTAANTALNTLQQMSQGLAEQISTFDLTDAAAIRYRLTMGSLSDEVKKAGAAGKALSLVIREQAETLDHLNRVKSNAAGLVGVGAQIDEFQGNHAQAAVANFDQSNLQLFKDLTKEADETGLKQLSTLRDIVGVQAEYNSLQTKASVINEGLAAAEERIRNSQEVGAISELEALQQLDTARSASAMDLQEIYNTMKKISDNAGSPDLVNSTVAFGHALDQLRSQTDLFGQKFKMIFEDNFSNAFTDFVTGTKTAGDAFKSFAVGVIQEIVRLSAQLVASAIFKFFTGGGSAAAPASGGKPSLFGIALQAFQAFAGAGGGLGGGSPVPGGGPSYANFAALASQFGRASGGPVSAGSPYMVGERGPELFIPNAAGNIRPNGGGDITVNLIESQERAGQVQKRQDNGRQTVDVFVTDIRGGGPQSSVLENTYGLRRVGK